MYSTPYSIAQEAYAQYGVDTDVALATLARTPISLHCWQGDDVGGFEKPNAVLSGGGIQATGNYPGKARTIDELRADIEQALALIPGKHRLNLHACYADLHGRKVERNAYAGEHFQGWIDWAKAQGLGLDFNPTCFGHPLADSGFTLSHPDAGIRQFWIEHCAASRRIGAEIGRQLGTVCVTNVWIPDGYKDTPADRKAPRERLEKALDAVFAEELNPKHNLGAVESKLFGIGCEDYTVGSHEFYLAYAARRRVALCYDLGHFHPTESVADKISSTLLFVDRLLIHASRGIRWDSDHVVRFTDELRAVCDEVVRGAALDHVLWALDYFDASINRMAAWVIGARALRKALLFALLEPFDALRDREERSIGAAKLALVEHRAELPFAAVWDYACLADDVPVGAAWLRDIAAYEVKVLATRV